MSFSIIYFCLVQFSGAVLGRFSQCNFKIFRHRPTMVADIFTIRHFYSKFLFFATKQKLNSNIKKQQKNTLTIPANRNFQRRTLIQQTAICYMTGTYMKIERAFIKNVRACMCVCYIKKFSVRRCRSSHPQVLYRKGVSKNFTKFTGKHLHLNLFNELAGLRLRCFLVNFVKFLGTPFSIEHVW